MKKIVLALAFFLAGCGYNDFRLINTCPEIDDKPAGLSNKEAIHILGCPQPYLGELPDLSEFEILPWGVTRIGGPLIATNRTVWVLDTGVDLDHPDLNVDMDRGRNFSLGTGATLNDRHGHGTHVAGTIAAKQNGIGVIGVAPGQLIVPVKVLSDSGWGSWQSAIAAMQYVLENASPGDVVNMSFGGYKHEDSVEFEALVLEAADKGILFSVAAGNSHQDANAFHPAGIDHPNVYTVSAIDKEDCRASFSNFGQEVEFAAPGVGVLSSYKDGEYKVWKGTSMAAPHVAGLLLFGPPRLDGFVYCGHTPAPGSNYEEPIAHY